MSRSGADLALLLLGGYRVMIDTATAELSAQGFVDFTPLHEFTLRAIVAGADSASELGRRTAVSKQAAAKTVTVLVQRGYVTGTPDLADARRTKLRVTDRGREVMARGEAILDEVRTRWEAELGGADLADLERKLKALVGDAAIRIDAPGWVATERG